MSRKGGEEDEEEEGGEGDAGDGVEGNGSYITGSFQRRSHTPIHVQASLHVARCTVTSPAVHTALFRVYESAHGLFSSSSRAAPLVSPPPSLPTPPSYPTLASRIYFPFSGYVRYVHGREYICSALHKLDTDRRCPGVHGKNVKAPLKYGFPVFLTPERTRPSPSPPSFFPATLHLISNVSANKFSLLGCNNARRGGGVRNVIDVKFANRYRYGSPYRFREIKEKKNETVDSNA